MSCFVLHEVMCEQMMKEQLLWSRCKLAALVNEVISHWHQCGAEYFDQYSSYLFNRFNLQLLCYCSIFSKLWKWNMATFHDKLCPEAGLSCQLLSPGYRLSFALRGSRFSVFLPEDLRFAELLLMFVWSKLGLSHRADTSCPGSVNLELPIRVDLVL